MRTAETQRSEGARILLVLLGAALVGLGIWLVASWVDTAYDSTCENAIRYWTSDNRRGSCRTPMSIRAVAGVGFGVLGACYLALAVVPARRLRGLTTRLGLAVTLALAAGALILNEMTRSDGLWEHG